MGGCQCGGDSCRGVNSSTALWKKRFFSLVDTDRGLCSFPDDSGVEKAGSGMITVSNYP